MNPLDAVTTAVEQLAKNLPNLLESCTDPRALDMAELLLVIREAREALQGVERDTEHMLGKAMVADQALSTNLRVERQRSPDRKAWSHDDWQRDVRAQALRKAGLLGAHVITAAGEELPGGVLHDLLAAVQSVHGSQAPKAGKRDAETGGLRAFGLDPQDYCETYPGGIKVSVYRMVGDGEGESDAA